MILSIMGCYRFLRSADGPRLNERTLRLYRALTNALALEFALSFSLLHVPASLMLLSIFCHWEDSSSISVVVLCWTEWYPVAVNVMFLVYIRPYRRGLLRMFGFKSENSVTRVPDVLTGNGGK